MISLRTYLITVGVLLLLSLSLGVYVWTVYQDVAREKEMGMESTAVPHTTVDGSAAQANVESMGASSEVVTEGGAVSDVTITPEMLTDAQRETLSTFGLGDKSMTITSAEIVCMEGSVGKERFDAIIGGSAPSPLEALRIGACLSR